MLFDETSIPITIELDEAEEVNVNDAALSFMFMVWSVPVNVAPRSATPVPIIAYPELGGSK